MAESSNKSAGYSQQSNQNAVDTLSVQALVSEKDESAQYPKETRGQNKEQLKNTI